MNIHLKNCGIYDRRLTIGCLLAGFAGAPSVVRCAPSAGLIVRTSTQTGRATFVTAPDRGPVFAPAAPITADRQPLAFLEEMGHLFGVSDPQKELRQIRTAADHLGWTHTTFEEIHDGVPVFTGVLKIHQDASGAVVAANGDFYPIPSKLNTAPTLSSDECVAIASSGLDTDEPFCETAELVIVDPGWYGDPPIGEHLAYYVVLSDLRLGIREAFFIDAHTGDVLDRWNLVMTARNRLVYDGQFAQSLPGSLTRQEGGAPVTNPAAVNYAYDYAGDTYDFFFRAFGRDSIDNAGLDLAATVNSVYPNCPNAMWFGQQTVFCEHTVTDDIVAHEFGHGITEYTAKLVYQNQPGQLNEAYSDIWGELIDLFNGDFPYPGSPDEPPWPKDEWYATSGLDAPNLPRTMCSWPLDYPDGVRWLMGEEAGAFGGAIRDMWNPVCFGDPDRANSPLQDCPAADNGGVHSGSGIPNHAFAIMTDGKVFNGQTVAGIGPMRSAAVWYRALTVYLTPSSDFRDAYFALNQAVQDLIGTNPLDPRTGEPSDLGFTPFTAEQVDHALLAVEMNTPGRCGAVVPLLDPEPPTECTVHRRIYFEDFEDGAPDWAVEVRGPHSPSFDPPPTPYDWELRDELPFDRPGSGWFCADPTLGNCTTQNEAARHLLYSPVIVLPGDLQEPVVAFHHYMASEPGWDGGNLKIRRFLDDPDDPDFPAKWSFVINQDFIQNEYNSRLLPAAAGNSNPLADTPAWTGVGGEWGTTLVDVAGYVGPGDRMQMVFDFGKDGCGGVDGWYMDDFAVVDCAGVEIVDSDPPSGAIDARRPEPASGRAPHEGWTAVGIVLDDPAGGLFGAFEISEVGGDGIAPEVAGITQEGLGTVRVSLSEPLEPGTWTRIEHVPTGWSTCLGYLPADVTGNGGSDTIEIALMLDLLDLLPLEFLPNYATDINRSGEFNAQDLLELIDLLQGGGDHAAWHGRSLPPSPCD